MRWQLAGHRDLTTFRTPPMDPDTKRLSDDKVHVPAAAPSQMERSMMRLLDRAQKAADGSLPARVCGLQVVFSLDGDAAVTWEFGTPSDNPGL